MHLLLLFTLVFGSAAFGSIREVYPGGCIQDTVNAASPGDTIIVHDGTYSATVVLYGKSLTIGSLYLLDNDTSHVAATVISPDASHPDTGSCFVYAYLEPSPNRLIGLTLTNGTGTFWTGPSDYAGGAVYVQRVHLELRRCQILSSSAAYGGGVYVYGNLALLDASALIRDTRIANCTSTFEGGGVYANHCSLFVHTSVFENNVSLSQAGGGIAALAYAEVDSCEVRGCSGIIGGIGLSHGGWVANTLFENNSATQIYWATDLSMGNGNFVAFNNVFRHNASLTRSVMLCCDLGDYISFVHNLVEGVELAGNPGGTVHLAGIRGDVSYNRFSDNGGEGLYSAIYGLSGATVRMHHNWFEGNHAAETATSVFLAGPNSHVSLDSNIIAGNRGQTVAIYDAMVTHTVDARNNWWGHPSGPYHPTSNPGGQGDTLISDSVLFIPWLTEPPDTTMPPGYLGIRESPAVAKTWELMDVYPNPFNSSVRIVLAGFTGTDFEITLHNLLGQIVDVVHTGPLTGGELFYTAPAYLASGVYFLKASDRHHLLTKKVVLMK